METPLKFDNFKGTQGGKPKAHKTLYVEGCGSSLLDLFCKSCQRNEFGVTPVLPL